MALVKAKAVQTAQKMSESCKETTTDIKLKSKVSGGVNDPVICGAVSTCEGVPTYDIPPLYTPIDIIYILTPFVVYII